MSTLTEDAKLIAELISNTTSDDRGKLLRGVAANLQLKEQFYIAHLIETAAYNYSLGTPMDCYGPDKDLL